MCEREREREREREKERERQRHRRVGIKGKHNIVQSDFNITRITMKSVGKQKRF